MYLAEGIIGFSGHLSTGTGLAINLDLVQGKIYTPKCNGNIEIWLSYKK